MGGNTPPPPRRTARVRNRLVGYVAVVAVAVAGAGAPAVALASGDLTESQRLVSLSELNGRALVLAHSLADERDTMTEFVAAGRTTESGAEDVSKSRAARVDRQIQEIGASGADVPAALRKALAGLGKVRQEAQSGRGPAMDTFQAYTAVLDALREVSTDLARRIPPRASGTVESLPALGRAVEEASATRALALAGLVEGEKAAAAEGLSSLGLPTGVTTDGWHSELTAATQRSRVQEQAALAEFDRTAPEDAVSRYENTVNGTEVSGAERYLTRLADQPELSPEDLALSRSRIDTALSGRLDRMRAVESALTTAETSRLSAVRDDDVTTLELRIALAGLCVLIAIGVSITAARSMTHPLAALRRGAQRVAADPAGEEPVKYTGRKDEFAEVVWAVNELRGAAARLHTRAEQLAEDRTRLVAERQRLADQRDELLAQQKELTAEVSGVADRVQGTYVNLAVRTLGLVERQLGVIEGLEDREADPERLDTLFKLDHLATRMRRHSENLLVLAGVEHGGWHGSGHGGAPVPLLDVLRAAVSEIERYERVDIHSLPPHAQVAGFAAEAISHLVAELLENATAFSPPDSAVQLSGWLLEGGEVMLSIQDEGIGMTQGRLDELNALLAEPQGEAPEAAEDDDALGLGLYVVARLAARHGVRVQLRQQKQGGIAAVAVLPKSLLPTRPTPSGPGTAPPPALPAVNLPGSVAEANSNTLPGRATALRAGGRFVETSAVGLSDGPPADGLPVDGPPADGSSYGADPAGDPLIAAAERTIAEERLAAAASAAGEPAATEADSAAAGRQRDGVPPLAGGSGQAAAFESTRVPEQAGPSAAPQAEEPDGFEASRRATGAVGEAGAVGGAGAEERRLTVPEQADRPDAAGSAASADAARPAEPADAGRQLAEVGALRADAPIAPAADSPYAIGADEHAHAADDAGLAGAPEGPTAYGTGTAARLPEPDRTAAMTATAAATADAPPARPAADAATTAPPQFTAAESAGAPAEGGAEAPRGPSDPQWERVTDKGLPKRMPKNVDLASQSSERTGSVDASALRAKLGGFHQGAKEGRRDAEKEIVGGAAEAEPVAAGSGLGGGDGAREGATTGTGEGANAQAGEGANAREREGANAQAGEQRGASAKGGTVEEARG
ncbi:nitrate- and nitrite sensing domain-containing protein [Streptomyces pathocidini]|uniref:sensor histidine kinase n=1 Tax=Streptomyces pathocidini TaxID=1650571 RepID=UPI0033E057C1